MTEKTIMTEQDIQHALTRISHEIIERNESYQELVLIGMHTRGVPLAQRLAATIKNLEQAEVPAGALDISFYRDDLFSLRPPHRVHHSHIPTNITGKCVILVDDVLFTGRSIRAAMDALIDFGRPQGIQLAVLVDRGHREMPIRADYVGRNIPTSRDEEVRLRLKETDGRDEVAIVSAVKGQPTKE